MVHRCMQGMLGIGAGPSTRAAHGVMLSPALAGEREASRRRASELHVSDTEARAQGRTKTKNGCTCSRRGGSVGDEGRMAGQNQHDEHNAQSIATADEQTGQKLDNNEQNQNEGWATGATDGSDACRAQAGTKQDLL